MTTGTTLVVPIGETDIIGFTDRPNRQYDFPTAAEYAAQWDNGGIYEKPPNAAFVWWDGYTKVETAMVVNGVSVVDGSFVYTVEVEPSERMPSSILYKKSDLFVGSSASDKSVVPDRASFMFVQTSAGEAQVINSTTIQIPTAKGVFQFSQWPYYRAETITDSQFTTYWDEGGPFEIVAPNAVLTWVDGNKMQEAAVVISDASYDETTQVAIYTVSCETEGCIGGAGALSQASLFVDDASPPETLPTDEIWPSGLGTDTWNGYQAKNADCVRDAQEKWLDVSNGPQNPNCIQQQENVTNNLANATIIPYCVGFNNFAVPVVQYSPEGVEDGVPPPFTSLADIEALNNTCVNAEAQAGYAAPTQEECETGFLGNKAFLSMAEGYNAAIKLCSTDAVSDYQFMIEECSWPTFAYATEGRAAQLFSLVNTLHLNMQIVNGGGTGGACNETGEWPDGGVKMGSEASLECFLEAAPEQMYRGACAPKPPPPPTGSYWDCVMTMMVGGIAAATMLAAGPALLAADTIGAAATVVAGSSDSIVSTAIGGWLDSKACPL